MVSGDIAETINIIWESIEWKYRFPRVEEKKGKLRVRVPDKLKVPRAT